MRARTGVRHLKPPEQIDAVVIGAGPAGLAAAEALCDAGRAPVLFEAKPTPARKFLMAGKSGLNLTKDETNQTVADVISCPPLTPILRGFGPTEVTDWARGLGEDLFVGSTGRVFPKAMKASPLLRRWISRLTDCGAIFRTGWRWQGWDSDLLVFSTPDGIRRVDAQVVVLALGGASWPRLGSDAAWVPWLLRRGVEVARFRPSNMGFDVEWSPAFRERFAGTPVKAVEISLSGRSLRGEFAVTATGVEGGGIYAISSLLRDALDQGPAALTLNLAPDRSIEALTRRLDRPRGRDSRANFLRKSIGLAGIRAGLLRELAPELPENPGELAALIRSLPLPIQGARPLAEAISSAGGVCWRALDDSLMLKSLPGVFAAGEMLDWEAPTGGYLLTTCLATGRHAGQAAARWAE